MRSQDPESMTAQSKRRIIDPIPMLFRFRGWPYQVYSVVHVGDSPMVDDRRSAIQSNVAYFDHVADHYAALYAERSPVGVGFRLRRQRLLEMFDQGGGSVLDVGCGPGVLVEDLLARGCKYWGVDHSPKMIEQCQRRFGERGAAQFRFVEGQKSGFPDSIFDAVICMGVLDRIDDDGGLLEELVRVLRPGGTLLVTASNRWSPYLWWRDYVYYTGVTTIRRLSRQPRHLANPRHRLYNAGSFCRRLSSMGVCVDDIAYTGYPVVPAPMDVALKFPAAVAMERLEVLRNGPLKQFGFGFIVKGRREGKDGVVRG